MKVVRIEKLPKKRAVKFTGGVSYRAVVAADKVGFSVNKTVIPVGPPSRWQYKHHQEACYCIKGSGMLVNLETNEAFRIVPDTVYVLDKHDNHSFEAFDEVILISIFNPPLRGDETHDENGNYSI